MVPTDAELAEQCLQGDNRGFDYLVKRYQKQVTAFCYRILGDTNQASDAAQEAFVKAYYALENFRQDALFLNWIMKIAANTCYDMLRKIGRTRTKSLYEDPIQADQLQSEEPSPEKIAINNEGHKLLWDAIQSLPVNHRMPLVLFHFHDMKLREIAEVLDRPEGTIKSSLHTARETLRRKLQGVIVEI
ncbi:sigma-70 family RNA polymerase sigma factor [bacterium]|nr:sigma-70 family RNA polymerase sigma factor [bacterium]